MRFPGPQPTKTALVAIWLALLISLLSTISAQVGNPPARPQLPADTAAFMEGSRLNQDQASAIEKTLAASPDDLNSRLKLLGHHLMTKNGDPDFAKHLLWLVDHRPESSVFDIGIIELNWYPSVAFMTEYQKHWEQAAAAHPSQSAVLSHAAATVYEDDRSLGLAYAKKAVKLDASCTRCRSVLGNLIGATILRLPGSMQGGWTCLPNTPATESTVSGLRKEIESSSDAELILDTGMTIKGSSGIYGSRCGGNSEEAARFGGELIRKAVTLDPSLIDRFHLQNLLSSITTATSASTPAKTQNAAAPKASARVYSMVGKITEIDCSVAPQMNLTLALGGVTMKLHAADLTKVSTPGASDTKSLSCTALRGISARIQYSLVSGRSYEGEILSMTPASLTLSQ